VDELFFEEIGALLVDGSGCFESGPDTSSDAEKELWTVLRLRGILPLSLTEAEAARRGALLAPASWRESGENARLGRLAAIFALERFNLVAGDDQNSPADGDGTVAAFVGPDFADIPGNSRPDGHGPDNPPDNRSDLRTRLAEQSKYSLNLDTAEALGFDPPAALIARIKEFVRQEKR
jgi:hypothetical protein